MRWALVVVGLLGCGDAHRATPDAAVDPAGDAAVDAPANATIDIIAFNDFHGAIEPVSADPGVAVFASQLATLRTPNSIVVSAGDMVGGSPFVSGLFHDEPTIGAMNLVGIDAAGVGNHEFDDGVPELLRMQHGGCHSVDGCQVGTSFAGASFPFLAANVIVHATGQTLFPPYKIVERDGIKIAIVGMTLKNTPDVTLSSRVAELDFLDEADTMTALLPELHAAGADVVVLALHQGGNANCTGDIVDVANRMPPEVAVIASGHTHQVYNCNIGGHVVTSAGAHGQVLTQIVLEIDRTTHAVVSAHATNTTVAGTPDPGVAALVDTYVQAAAPIGNRVIGTITADFPQLATESALGNLIADAMLEAVPGAQFAIMNTGGIRAPLTYAATAPETVDGQVRYAEAATTQPFGNFVSAIDVKGADLVAGLDNVLATSLGQVAGGTYSYSTSAPAGSRISNVTIGGQPLDPNATYRVAVNSIVLARVPNVIATTGVAIDLDLLVAYFAAHSPISPTPLDRITAIP